MTEEKKDDVKKEDADKAFDNEQMLDLSHDELYNIMAVVMYGRKVSRSATLFRP